MSKKLYPLTVKNLQKETEHAVVLSFEVPAELKQTFQFIQGQYLTLEHEIAGETIRRSYSICSGLDDGELKVAIKHVEGGVFSTWANTELKAGVVLKVMPPRGDFHSTIDPQKPQNSS
mgnify:CR=1 FL=1